MKIIEIANQNREAGARQ